MQNIALAVQPKPFLLSDNKRLDSMSQAIWWIRRDLRLGDNQALQGALQQAEQVIPLFILDPTLEQSAWSSPKRLAFLYGGLAALDASLRQCGSRLVVRRGQPAAVLAQLCQESGTQLICAEQDHSPYAQQRDTAIAASLPLVLYEGVAARPVGSVRQQNGKAYSVFTPYSRRWQAQTPISPAALLSAPTHIRTPATLPSLALPEVTTPLAASPFVPGESEAHRRLQTFVGGAQAAIYRYASERNRPDLAGTAQLSPYLRFGMVSARQAVVSAVQAIEQAPSDAAADSAANWYSELIWREFYINILHEFPFVRQRSFRQQYDTITWSNDESHFAAWCAGQTGYPLIDAAMQQLLTTGWMHNRLRMIVASFLVKHLLIDWRWGERWFMQNLVDGDPAANNGGWQWVAGVGTDAAPYFRVFNPVEQSKKFDPHGAFIRYWLPRLRPVPTPAIHAPWTLATSEQRRAGCVIGVDYPAPLVDHTTARERALAAYRVAVRPG